MTQSPPLPACCPTLNHHWPLPHALAKVVLVSARFDPAKLTEDDFQRCAVQPPASIQRSMPKRQAEFLAGRLCARAALQHLDQRDWVPDIGEDRAPIWPDDVCGSITHSHGWAAAIVAHKHDWRGLGLDTEKLLSHERATRLAGEILTPAEMKQLAAGPVEQTALRVTLTFSIKEALFKALFPLVNQRFYFHDAQLLEWSDTGHARLRLLTDLSSEWHNGKELDGQFSLHDGHLLSLVAVQG